MLILNIKINTKNKMTKTDKILQDIKDRIIIDLIIFWDPIVYKDGHIKRTIRHYELSITYSILCHNPDLVTPYFEAYDIDIELKNSEGSTISFTTRGNKFAFYKELVAVANKIINPDIVNKFYQLN
jgi:hypothetical protein